MAKKPDDLNQPLPPDDDLDAFAEFIDEPEQAEPAGSYSGSDSEIDLGIEPGDGSESLSGVSVVEWASLVDEPATPTAARITGSPSDADLVGPFGGPPAVTAAADFDEEDVIASDLAASARPDPKETHEAIDLGVDAIDLGDDAVIVDEDDSALGEVIDLSEPGISRSAGPESADGESGIDLMADDIVLEEPVSAGGSGRDLIAEGLESGVDLLGADKKGVKVRPAGDDDDALDDFLAGIGDDDPSSSVDLGSVHSMPAFNMDEFEQSTGSKPASSAAAAGDPSSGIDLSAMLDDAPDAPTPRSGKATVMADPDRIDLGDMDADDPDGWSKTDQVYEPDDEPEPAPVAASKKPAKADPDAAPAKKPKPEKKGGGGWVGGTLLGGVLATAAWLGTWTAGIDPPDALREMAGTKVAKPAPALAPVPAPNPDPVPGPAPAGPAAVALGTTLRSGDLDAIKPADLDKIDEAKPEELTARAQARWLLYVRQLRGRGMRADAEPVKLALADLAKAVQAGSADALFLRAEVHRRTGNRAAAEADYLLGVKQFAADADQKERFEAALEALTTSTAAARPAAGLPLAMLLVFGYQTPDAAPKPPAEPAPRFSRAVKLANEGKLAEAIKLVQEARALHDERRSVLPNRPVNPRTDPSEETFLRACDQVIAYYTLAMKLRNPEYLSAAPADRVAAVDALIKKGQEAAAAEVTKDLGEKIKVAEAERKASADKAADLGGKLTASMKESDGLSAKLKDLTAALEAKDKLLAAAAEREKGLAATNEASASAMKTISEAVGVRFTDLKATTPALVKEVRDLKRTAATADPMGQIRKLEGERDAVKTKLEGELTAIKAKLEGERDAVRSKLETERNALKAKLEGERDAALAKLKDRWEPAELLAAWLPAVDGARDRGALADKALTDAGRVLRDPSATPAQKAQARALTGLVARNRDLADDAKATLTAALPGLTGEWRAAAEAALRRTEDPGTDIADQAQALADQGKTKEALSLLDKGIRSSAGKKGALFAQRGRITLERARTSGDSKLAALAQKDAEDAAKEGSAEGLYLGGRIAEEGRDWAKAERLYREAIQKHGALDEAGARYRAGLARVLLRRSAADGGVRTVPPALRTGKLDLHGLNALLTAAVYAPEVPAAGPGATEAERLADEILAAGDRASFDARAQALAVKGLHTRALRTYVAGLRDKGLLTAEHANGLLDLVNDHPALRRPDVRTEPDPVAGEKLYAAGLRFFAAERWADAEREFVAAVENDGGDARYHYFLGIARVAQGNRGGFEDFDRAAARERAGRPDRAAVSAALERIQGPMREVLNGVRSRPPRERAK
ncbi:MAG: hypothetical protein ACRC33_12150 [Gemmataceae bacterium]